MEVITQLRRHIHFPDKHADFDQAVKLGCNDVPVILYRAGIFRQEKGDWEGSKTVLEKVIQLLPDAFPEAVPMLQLANNMLEMIQKAKLKAEIKAKTEASAFSTASSSATQPSFSLIPPRGLEPPQRPGSFPPLT